MRCPPLAPHNGSNETSEVDAKISTTALLTYEEISDLAVAALCRYGYASVKQITRVVQSYAYAKIPLETFVTDSQYMDHDQDFTFSDDYTPSEMQVGFATL